MCAARGVRQRVYAAVLCMLCISVGNVSAQAETPPVLHQRDIQQLVRFKVSEAIGCTRLLASDRQIGCGADGIEAELVSLKPPDLYLKQQAAVVISAKDLSAFLSSTAINSTLQQLVKGVLVDPTETPQIDSPATKFPLSEYAPYSQPDFAWNPTGSGLARQEFPFPIMLLDNITALPALQKAAHNQQHNYQSALHYAQLESIMTASSNSSSCIREQSCQPLGGHSVWGAAPPLATPINSSLSRPLPIVMLLSAVDSDAMFRSATQGADSAMGSLVTLLAVADVLGNNTAAVATYSKRLVLTALVGEPWDYMGCKRLLWEISSQADTTTGLSLDQIEQVVEIGQVGRASSGSGQNFTFFTHSQQQPVFGNPALIVQSLQQAARSVSDPQINIQPASPTNPGIPPASLSSFLRVKPSIQGVLFAEHRAAFTNPYYQSRFDDAANVQLSSVTAAAVVVAKALHNLAASQETPQLQVDETAVQETVSQLVDCLLRDSPGLHCPLARQLLGEDIPAAVDHYVGPLRTLTKQSQDPVLGVKSSLELFIFSFMTQRLSHGPLPTAAGGCDVHDHKCPSQSTCSGYIPGQTKGHCVNATVKFVPSYSTHFSCKDCDASSSFQWQENNDATAWENLYAWPPDLMWTESNWPFGQPAFQLFQKESPAAARLTLVAGFATAIASMAIIWTVQSMHAKTAQQNLL